MEIKENDLFKELVDITKKLRGKDGCPWDRKQTHESLIPCLREESEEVIAAIEKGDMENLEEELGDLLFQVMMHAQIADENGEFRIEDVIAGISRKMIRRHPHVFGDLKETDEKKLRQNWEEIKKQEREEKERKK